MSSAPASKFSLSPADILSSIATAHYEWSIPSDQLTWSANAGAVLGGVADAALSSGRSFAQLLSPKAAHGRYETVVNSGTRDSGDGVPYCIEYPIIPAPGVTLWIEDTGRWFASDDGRPQRAHGVVRVVNDRHDHVTKLTEASEVDPLTGLMARPRFTATLEEAIVDAEKVRGAVGLLVIGIDNLAHYNDAYGFAVTDEIISAIGRRLRGRLRGGDVIGRLSGNKFGILMRNCSSNDLSVAAERLVAAVNDDVFQTKAGPIVASVTVGAVLAPRHASTMPEALARAHEALDSIRTRRRGTFAVHVPNAARDMARQENIRVTDEIVSALNERRIGLAFQPIVSAQGERGATSYECLLRLRRLDGTVIAAGSIVPIAEKLGLVRLIDSRVLELAVSELVASPEVNLSVNVSPATTLDKEWLAALAAHTRRNTGVAERLMIEITETSAIADIEDTRAFISKVKDLGIRVAIDDFGAGYTSFRNLRRLGVDCVKIDGAFVENFDKNADDRHFVETLLGLARHMDLRTVAEWVQNDAVATRLADMGCDFLQGAFTGSAVEERPWVAPDVEAKAG